MNTWPFAQDTRPAPHSTDSGPAPGRTARKHRWLRWIAGGFAALVLLAFGATAAFVKLQSSPAPLTLPAGAASAPAGPLDGTWRAGAGSLAGLRVQETVLGMSNDVVGRTDAVTGTITISGDQATSATFRVNLTAVTFGGKAQPQFAASLDTRDHPAATFTLTQPMTLGPGFATGATIAGTAGGLLTMHGVSRPVTVTLSGRRDGSALQVAGSIPVLFSAWGINGPAGYGFFGSLAGRGTAEFRLVLQHG